MKFILTALGLIILITTQASAQAIELRCKIRPQDVVNTKSLIIDLNKNKVRYKHLARDLIFFDEDDNTKTEYSKWNEIYHSTNDFLFWIDNLLASDPAIIRTVIFDRETGVLVESHVVGYPNKAISDTKRVYSYESIWDCKRRIL